MLRSLIYLFFVVIVFSCKAQEKKPLNLMSKLPSNITFDDSSIIFIDQHPIGKIKVRKVTESYLLASLLIQKDLAIPNNSVLIFHESHMGEGSFEIRKGTSKTNFAENEEIFCTVDSIKNSPSDPDNHIKGPDLNKLTKPNIIRKS